MNKKLIQAELDLIDILKTYPDGLDMKEILSNLDQHGESELRAALWTLVAEGKIILTEDYKAKLV